MFRTFIRIYGRCSKNVSRSLIGTICPLLSALALWTGLFAGIQNSVFRVEILRSGSERSHVLDIDSGLGPNECWAGEAESEGRERRAGQPASVDGQEIRPLAHEQFNMTEFGGSSGSWMN